MKTLTLLDKALASSPIVNPKNISDEEMDLMIALINGDINLGQAGRAFGQSKTRSMYLAYRAFSCVRDAIRWGKIPRIKRTNTKNGKARVL